MDVMGKGDFQRDRVSGCRRWPLLLQLLTVTTLALGVLPHSQAQPGSDSTGSSSDAGASDAAPSAREQADALYHEGFKLWKEAENDDGKQQACQRFRACYDLEKEHGLDHSVGNVLNLGRCRKEVDKDLPGAWNYFAEAGRIAERTGQPRRTKLAQEYAAKVRPQVGLLTIVAPTGVADLKVELDGAVIPPNKLGLPYAVSPGSHQLTARAPSHTKTFSEKVELIEGKGKRVVVVLGPPVAPVPTTTATAPVPTATATATPTQPPDEDSTTRTWGYVLVGTGAVITVVGAVLGIVAMGKVSDAEDDCPDKKCNISTDPGRDGREKLDQATIFGHVSTVAIPVGLVAAATGLILVLTSGDSEPDDGAEAQFEFGPMVDEQSVGFRLWGRF